MSDDQFNVQGYNIVTILKRLEAATSRLEDITIFQDEALRPADDMAIGSHDTITQNEPATLAPKDAQNAPSLIAAPPESSKNTTAASAPPFVAAFSALVSTAITPFVQKSQDLDPVVGEAAALLQRGFDEQKAFLGVVARAKKPQMADPAFLALLQPTNEIINDINNLKDKHRGTPWANHLATVSEGSSVLGWIVSDTPVLMIPEFKDLAQFWANRVSKEHKDQPEQQQWVKAFLGIFDSLQAYVKEFHATGPSWNPKGLEVKDLEGKSEEKSAPGASASVPAPPPPPPANLFDESAPTTASSGMGAVFADLNQGSGVTSGLKKVDKLQMTHKNPELRKQASLAGPKKPLPPKKPTNLSKRKPARKDLVDGSKWLIENYTEHDASEPIVIETDMSQLVFIGNCQGITVQIKGKANAVSVLDTKLVGVAVDSLISGIDVIKSSKFGVQVTGVVPMVSIDLSDEGSLYLSQESIDGDVQVYTSSTTTMNIYVPQDGDFVELAVPEQFKHSVKGGKLASGVVEHVA